jgi:hypothetical protein
MEHILEVDSSERDCVEFPDPNDYTVALNTPIYNITNLKLISARIPTFQYMINAGNKQFDVDNQTIVLTEGNYTGTTLASMLQTSLAPPTSNIDSVIFTTATNALTFSNTAGTSNCFSMQFYSGSNGYTSKSVYGTPATVLGFQAADTPFTSNITSGAIDLTGPSNLIIRVACNDDDLEKALYVDGATFSFGSNTYNVDYPPVLEPFYMGRIIAFSDTKSFIELKGANDAVEFYFHRGPVKVATKLRFRWYYNNCNKLVPYDFRGQNHFMKFKLTCVTDKFKIRDKEDLYPELPKPIDVPFLDPPKRTFLQTKLFIYTVIGILTLIGIFLVHFSK